jgi:hypothetical protein
VEHRPERRLKQKRSIWAERHKDTTRDCSHNIEGETRTSKSDEVVIVVVDFKVTSYGKMLPRSGKRLATEHRGA